MKKFEEIAKSMGLTPAQRAGFMADNGWPEDPAQVFDPDVQELVIEKLSEWAHFSQD